MKKYMTKELTQERLREVLNYNPNTGIFTWRIDRRCVKAGDIAGYKKENGYLRIMIDGKSYTAHRLAWFYFYGYWPKKLIYKNRIRNTNWIKNLKELSPRNMGEKLTQKRLREVLDYNSETGIFTWKIYISNTRDKVIAGYKEKSGYLRIWVDRKLYYAHRLAWFYFYGYWPKYIDHRNRVRDANWIMNLREASSSDNKRNSKVDIRNTSGIRGVRYDKNSKKWHVRIRNMNKHTHLGSFDNKIDAARVRLKAERRYGWEDYDIYESSAHRYIRKYEENLLLENSMREELFRTNDFDKIIR